MQTPTPAQIMARAKERIVRETLLGKLVDRRQEIATDVVEQILKHDAECVVTTTLMNAYAFECARWIHMYALSMRLMGREQGDARISQQYEERIAAVYRLAYGEECSTDGLLHRDEIDAPASPTRASPN